jgi:hypothetical protein
MSRQDRVGYGKRLVVDISCFIPRGSWGEVGISAQYSTAQGWCQNRDRAHIGAAKTCWQWVRSRRRRLEVHLDAAFSVLSHRPRPIANSYCSHSLRSRRLGSLHCCLSQDSQFSFTGVSDAPFDPSQRPPGLDRIHWAPISTTRQKQSHNTRLGADVLSNLQASIT